MSTKYLLAAFFNKGSFFAFCADIAHLYSIKVASRHALNLSLRAANSNIDLEALQDPEQPVIIIKEQEAQESFYSTLQANLNLTSGMMPTSKSIADGPVNVLYFKVVNAPPFSYSYGSYSETLTKVGSTGIIEVPVKLSPFARVAGLPETVTIKAHSTVYVDFTPNSP